MDAGACSTPTSPAESVVPSGVAIFWESLECPLLQEGLLDYSQASILFIPHNYTAK